MTWAEFLPLIFMTVMGLALLAYVVLDGYDLGVGLLLPLAESKEQTALIGSPNQVEAVMSNLQKRAAVYAD